MTDNRAHPERWSDEEALFDAMLPGRSGETRTHTFSLDQNEELLLGGLPVVVVGWELDSDAGMTITVRPTPGWDAEDGAA